MFEKVMRRLAEQTNCFCEIDGNTARLIEKDKHGNPSKEVWAKTFILSGSNVTVKVHGRTMMVPLASLT